MWPTSSPSMSKTKKFIPDLRIRKPYKREPKAKHVPPYVPFETFDMFDEEDTVVDEVIGEETDDRRHRNPQV